MPATIRSLTAKEAETYIEMDGDPQAIWIKYNPRKYTARLEREIATSIKDNLNVGSLIPALRELLIEWDLRMDEGEPVIDFHDENVMLGIPGEVLFAVVNRIGEEQNPDPKAG